MAARNHQTSNSPPQSPQSSEPYSGRSPMIERKSSSSSTASYTSPISPAPSPKVQLVPYARSASFEISLSDAERRLVDAAATKFDALDLSSQDFDFDEIFTYDKPQRKLTKGVVEVSTPTRTQRDWSSFSYSHYSTAIGARMKVNSKAKASIGEMYVKNKSHGSGS